MEIPRATKSRQHMFSSRIYGLVENAILTDQMFFVRNETLFFKDFVSDNNIKEKHFGRITEYRCGDGVWVTLFDRVHADCAPLDGQSIDMDPDDMRAHIISMKDAPSRMVGGLPMITINENEKFPDTVHVPIEQTAPAMHNEGEDDDDNTSAVDIEEPACSPVPRISSTHGRGRGGRGRGGRVRGTVRGRGRGSATTGDADVMTPRR